MANVSNTIDMNLGNAIKTIMKIKSANPQWQDYEVLNDALAQGNKDVAIYLLDHNCTINKSTSPAVDTPLHHAVRLADIPLITKLLEKAASITAVNAESNSPVHLAFLLNYIEIVDLFLTHIEQTLNYEDVSNNNNLTHFHIACARGNVQLAHDFDYTGADIKTSVNKDSLVYPNHTCLLFACSSKSIATIEVLLKATDPPGSCVNDTPREQSTSLRNLQNLGRTLIEMHHESFSIMEGSMRLSKFQAACFHGRVDEVKSFLEKGQDVNAVMTTDAFACPLYSPLHFAMEAKDNREELVGMLLAHGANVNLRDGFGMTPLHLALYCDQDDGVLKIIYEAVKDKEENLMDMFGLTYFHVAIALNDMEMVKKLIEKGEGECKPILPNCRNFAKYTPLHFAVKYGHEEIAKMLIERGADVNANEYESQFETPIQTAINNGECKMAEFLLANGANPKVKTFETKLSTLHLLVERFNSIEDKNSGVSGITYSNESESYCIDATMGEFIEIADPPKYPDGEKARLLGLVKTLVKHGADVDAKDEKLNTALHKACKRMDERASMVRELLIWGADVNAKNWRLDTAFDVACRSVKRITIRNFTFFHYHVQQLKILGMKIDPKNESFCEMFEEMREGWKKGDDRVDLFLKCIYDSLRNEVERLKKDMLDEKVSLYDYLNMDVEKAAAYVENKRLCSLTAYDDGWTYPNYSRLALIMHWKTRHWLAVRQSKKSNKLEKIQAETIVVKKPLLHPKPSPPSINRPQQQIPVNATLHDVVTLGNVQLVKDMLARGSSINIYTSTKNSPLHLAFISNHTEIVDLLLSHIREKSIYINLKNIHGLTHLHIAASRGDTFVVEKLLEARANPSDFVNDKSPYYPGYNAIRFACESKSLAMVKLLSGVLNLLVYPSPEDSEFTDFLDGTVKLFMHKLTRNQLSSFHNACLMGSAKEVERFLMRGVDVNAVADRNSKMNPSYTALHFAVESPRDRLSKVHLLLEHGADVNRRDGFCTTPLHLLFYADRKKDERESFSDVDVTFKLLYEAAKKKQWNLMDACGFKYFHIAAAVGDCNSVKRMLFYGEDVNGAVIPNSRAFSKYTALHFAAENGQHKMVKLLIERGAKVDANDNDPLFNTPLQTAIVAGQGRVADILLENGANAKVIRSEGRKSTIHLLAEQVADGGWRSFLETSLFSFDQLWLIDKLVKLGVDIDAKDSNGLTALHTACFEMFDHRELVETLLDHGADINVKNNNGDTPLDLACRGKFRHNYSDFARLYDHVQKIKDIGLEVDQSNEEFCELVMDRKDAWIEHEEENGKRVEKLFSEETMARKRRERLKEIEMLKKDMLTEEVSLYDYLKMTPEQAAVYAKNERIQYIIEDDEPRILYEIYGYLIPVVYRKSLKCLDGSEKKNSGKKTHRGSRKRAKAVCS